MKNPKNKQWCIYINDKNRDDSELLMAYAAKWNMTRPQAMFKILREYHQMKKEGHRHEADLDKLEDKMYD